MNKIVVELHPEDRARLDLLAGRLARVADLLEPVKVDFAPLQEGEIAFGLPVDGAAHLEPIDAPAAAAPVEPAAVEPVTAPVAEPMGLAEFQKVVTMWLAANPAKKPQARDLVNRYAPSATEIPAEKRAEFLAELDKL